MAEDLDAEMENYWKNTSGTQAKKVNLPIIGGGKKKIVSLTGKKRVPVPTPVRKEPKIVSLKGKKKQLTSSIDRALPSSRPAPNTEKNQNQNENFNKPKRRKRINYNRNFGNQQTRDSNPFHPSCLARETQELSPESVIFPGKTKLFIGGLPKDYTQAQVEELLEPFGELLECYLPQGKAFAIVTFASREYAYKAQIGLSGKTLEGGMPLRVRPSPDAAVWIGDLPTIATNELLRTAFLRFGPINRAIVCCDTRGRPLGYGVVEFAYKGSATNCIETTTTQPFLLSRSPQPVRIEPYRYKEEDIGLPAKEVLTDRFYWNMIESECGGAPRMGTNEPIAMEWLKLYQQQKIAKQALKEQFQQERKELTEKMNAWFEEEEQERLRASAEVRNQRMEIMRREEQLRANQAQLDHQAASVSSGFGAW